MKKKLNEAAEKEAELLKQIEQLQQQLKVPEDLKQASKEDKGA